MNMFKPTAAKTPKEYFASIKEPDRKADLLALDKIIRKIAPTWKPYILVGMVGYGSYHYKGRSGREGDWPVIALSNRAAYISLYLSCATKEGKYVAEQFKKALPKANIGKSCVRFKRLSDLDPVIVEKMIREAVKSQK